MKDKIYKDILNESTNSTQPLFNTKKEYLTSVSTITKTSFIQNESFESTSSDESHSVVYAKKKLEQQQPHHYKSNDSDFSHEEGGWGW
jgi:hypothetical protein